MEENIQIIPVQTHTLHAPNDVLIRIPKIYPIHTQRKSKVTLHHLRLLVVQPPLSLNSQASGHKEVTIALIIRSGGDPTQTTQDPILGKGRHTCLQLFIHCIPFHLKVNIS